MAQSFDIKTTLILPSATLFIAALVDGHCPPKSINSDVLQGSVLSPTVFLLFINDVQNQILAQFIHLLMIPPYIFPRLFKGDRPFRKLADHTGTPQVPDF